MKKKPTPPSAIPSAARILQRDWMHASTEDINRTIARLRAEQKNAEEDLARLRFSIGGRQRIATDAKADADALEALVETRK